MHRPPAPAVIEPAEQELLDQGRVRVDLAAARASGALRIDANDPLFLGRLDPLFDGDPETMARTESINPLQLTLTFDQPLRLAVVRVVLAGSPYDWHVEPVAGGERHILRGVPERVYSPIPLPETVETSQIRFEFRRLERDDYVHVSELELWSEGVE
ncbi:MAG TPA: hypothetical protein VMS76_17820 [Planctomycetota bacterium]|nr:hypothetical protein [Planctomycetota bacterium]